MAPLRANQRVILVSDPVNNPPEVETGEFDRRLDRPWPSTVAEIAQGLITVCGADKIIRYSSLSDFIDHAAEHRTDVVFPYWFGEKSRSRHGLLPAICEAYGIQFVGADAFTKIVCNDKELSKMICRDAGLEAPPALVLYGEEDLEHLELAGYPAVIKPNFEGTSLGVSNRNLVLDAAGARIIAGEVLQRLGQPVLVERFVAGREVNICLMGCRREVTWLEAISWEISGDPTFLDEKLFTYDVKIGSGISFKPIRVTDTLQDGTIAAAKRLFRNFDKVDAMRIDGRLGPSGEFSVIELTPDLHLGSDGEMAATFQLNGMTYCDMISALLLNALNG